MTPEQLRALVAELAGALRERVLPHLGSHAGRAHGGEAPGGDVTFAIDADAEEYLADWVAARAPGVAFFSEDAGLVEPSGSADWVLVVDPIDGTRPAMAGFEMACVSVAAAPLDDEPRMGDVVAGCVVEIKCGNRFVAARGEGVEADVPVRPPPTRRWTACSGPTACAGARRGRPWRSSASWWTGPRWAGGRSSSARPRTI